jgi:predicted small metal-binding protein
MADNRYRIDCGKVPSESGCTLVMEGPEEDLLDAAVQHAQTKHGHTESPDVLRETIRKDLERV